MEHDNHSQDIIVTVGPWRIEVVRGQMPTPTGPQGAEGGWSYLVSNGEYEGRGLAESREVGMIDALNRIEAYEQRGLL